MPNLTIGFLCLGISIFFIVLRMPIGLALGGPAIGGLMLALGLFSRPLAFALMFIMIVALRSHLVSGEGTPAHAFKNAWLFGGLVLTGPGRYSLDHLLARRRSASK